MSDVTAAGSLAEVHEDMTDAEYRLRLVSALERIAAAMEQSADDLGFAPCEHPEWETQGTMGNVTRRCKDCGHEERVQ